MTEVVTQSGFDRAVQDFDRQRHAVFEGLARELQQASADPAAAEFGKVLSHAQKVLGKSDLQISQLFKVSRPTVNRWTRGVTAPHPMLRKAIFDSLLGELRQAIKGLRFSG
jgi:hypothetical protein